MFKYLFVFGFLLIQVKSQCTGVSNVNVTEAKAKLDEGSIAFSTELIYQRSQSNPGENFVLSAASLLILLANLALFSQNLVYEQLVTLLNLDSKNEIKAVYLQETPSYANQQNVEFEIANKYYANVNYPLTKSFKCQSLKYFNSTGENIDFSENVQAADTINEWVKERTRDKIQDLVSPDMFNADTVVVLVNAIYFLGDWVHQFNPNNTAPRNFTTYNGDVVKLPTMYQQNTFKYAENDALKLKALEMPYKNNNFSLFIILPDLGYFDKTVQLLRDDPEVFTTIRNDLSYEKVNVYMPKMLINTDLNVVDMLIQANVTAMFEPGNDGFKGILTDDQDLYISSGVQKAFISVDETGTEAAAATAIGITTLAMPFPPPQIYDFDVDMPCILYIVFNNVPLFAGVFVGAD